MTFPLPCHEVKVENRTSSPGSFHSTFVLSVGSKTVAGKTKFDSAYTAHLARQFSRPSLNSNLNTFTNSFLKTVSYLYADADLAF